MVDLNRWSYEFEAWMPKMGSKPIMHIESYDNSESYEQEKGHIFLLENRKYAVIHESGCSCYESADAECNILETLHAAKIKFSELKHNV